MANQVECSSSWSWASESALIALFYEFPQSDHLVRISFIGAPTCRPESHGANRRSPISSIARHTDLFIAPLILFLALGPRPVTRLWALIGPSETTQPLRRMSHTNRDSFSSFSVLHSCIWLTRAVVHALTLGHTRRRPREDAYE